MLKYLKDRIGIFFAYFISIACILSYLSLTINEKIEIVYPFVIAFFFFSIYIFVDLRKYLKFTASVNKTCYDYKTKIIGYNEEQKLATDAISSIIKNTTRDVESLKSNHSNWKLFISQWVHNLKTPATVIDLAIQKLKNKEANVESTINTIHDENKRIVENLNNILNLIRLDDFTKDYVPEAFDLRKQLQDIINENRSLFIYSEIYPTLNIPEEVIVICDKKWNKVMLEQLLSNAIKYTAIKRENKKIKLSTYIDADRVILSILDSGIGIPKHDLKRIFEPFFTGENGRIVKGSTGIGLYVVKSISEKLELNLKVKSDEGIGTTFTISYLSKM